MTRGIRLIICWKARLSILVNLLNNAKLVTCNRRYSLFQCNVFSNVFQRKSKVELQTQWFPNQFCQMTIFLWSQIKHYYIVVFEVSNWN